MESIEMSKKELLNFLKERLDYFINEERNPFVEARMVTYINDGIEKINASTSIGSYFGSSSDPQNHRIEGTDYFGTYGTNIYTYFKRIDRVSVDGNVTDLSTMRVAYCSDATKGHATTTNNVIYWSNCEPIQTNNKEFFS